MERPLIERVQEAIDNAGGPDRISFISISSDFIKQMDFWSSQPVTIQLHHQKNNLYNL